MQKRFSVDNFCLTVAEKIIGEHFCVSKKIRYRKNLCIRGLYPDFPSKVYCLTVPKTFVEEIFCGVFQKIFCFSIETFR